jgi:ABC-type transporter Mla subunit MlaD
MYSSSRTIHRRLSQLEERVSALEGSQAASQQQIDQITAELGTTATGLAQLSADLGSAQSTLQAEIDSIVAGNQPNLDNLQAAADALGPVAQAADEQAQAIGQLVPTPPPAPPAP